MAARASPTPSTKAAKLIPTATTYFVVCGPGASRDRKLNTRFSMKLSANAVRYDSVTAAGYGHFNTPWRSDSNPRSTEKVNR